MDLNVEYEIKEFRDADFVKSVDVIFQKETFAMIRLVTLEGDDITLEWSTQNGIRIKECSRDEFVFKKYDSFEQLLNETSPLYCSKFQTSLFDKLMALQGNQVEEETCSDSE